MAQQKSLTVNFFGRDVTLSKALDGIKKNTFATSNVLEQGSKKATYVLGALGAAALKFAKAAADDEKGAVSLANTLKTVTNASASQIAGVEKFISKAELFSTIADDKIRPAFDTLARATGSIGKAQSMTNLALEIATKRGVDVEQVANAMAKASRGQFKALAELTKIAPKSTKANTVYGSSLKVVNGQLTSVQKAMGKTQKTTESLDHYLARVGTSFNGSIAAQSKTASYKLAQFNVAMDHVQETLGAMLLPYMKDFADWLMKIEPFVEKHKDAIKQWGIAIASLAVGIKLLNGAYKAFKLTEAIVGFTRLGQAATVAGTQAASAGRIAAAGWGWVGLTLAAITTINELTKDLEKNRKEKLYNPNKMPSWASGSNKSFPNTSMYDATKKHMAAGGVVMRPTTAMIAESGPEAVIPLNRPNAFGGITVVNNIQGSVITQNELIKFTRDGLAQLLRRKGLPVSVLGV